jgi:bifunctional non-homologous end joining protein LigD
LARRDAAGVRLISRKGDDLTRRFPFIDMAVAALPLRSCLIDGEAIVSNENGLAIFEMIGAIGRSQARFYARLRPARLDGEDLQAAD